jgi:hypothetical protein
MHDSRWHTLSSSPSVKLSTKKDEEPKGGMLVMKGRKTHVLPETGFENLDVPPHVLSQLIDMLLGNWQPAPADLEVLLSHLVECLHCQLALGTLIALELHSDLAEEDHSTLRNLLAQLTDLIHETQIDDLVAYLEVLEAQGQAEASSRFPVLAEHLQHCQDCRSTIEETRVLLRSTDQVG